MSSLKLTFALILCIIVASIEASRQGINRRQRQTIANSDYYTSGGLTGTGTSFNSLYNDQQQNVLNQPYDDYPNKAPNRRPGYSGGATKYDRPNVNKYNYAYNNYAGRAGNRFGLGGVPKFNRGGVRPSVGGGVKY